jgi:hypothetical protein
MKHVISLACMIGLASVLLCTSAHTAAWLIELHNGRELIARSAWEEGDYLMFDTAHGTAGVPKAQVKRMTPATTVSDDKVWRRAFPGTPPETRSSPTATRAEPRVEQDTGTTREAGDANASAEHPSDGDRRVPAGEVTSDRAKKARLTSQLDEATQRYREAAAANHLEMKSAALADMRAYRKQILELGDEVKHKHGGELPSWWNE